jgi:hypothetical protein
MFHREAAFCLEAREFRLRLILNHVAAVSTKAREAQVTMGQRNKGTGMQGNSVVAAKGIPVALCKGAERQSGRWSRLRATAYSAAVQHWNNETDCEASEFRGAENQDRSLGCLWGIWVFAATPLRPMLKTL